MGRNESILKSKFLEVEELIQSAYEKRERILCELFQSGKKYFPGDVVKFTSFSGDEIGVLSIPRMRFHSLTNFPDLWVVHMIDGSETFISDEQIMQKTGFDKKMIDSCGHWRG